MEMTIFLAKFFGILMIVKGLLGLTKGQDVFKLAEALVRDKNAVFTWGMIFMMFGLALVLTHNVWDNMLEIIVSGISWLIFLASLIILFGPNWYASMAKGIAKQFRLWGLITLVIGIYLTYQGFNY